MSKRSKKNRSFGGPPRSKGYNRTLGLRNPDASLNGPVVTVGAQQTIFSCICGFATPRQEELNQHTCPFTRVWDNPEDDAAYNDL